MAAEAERERVAEDWQEQYDEKPFNDRAAVRQHRAKGVATDIGSPTEALARED